MNPSIQNCVLNNTPPPDPKDISTLATDVDTFLISVLENIFSETTCLRRLISTIIINTQFKDYWYQTLIKSWIINIQVYCDKLITSKKLSNWINISHL